MSLILRLPVAQLQAGDEIIGSVLDGHPKLFATHKRVTSVTPDGAGLILQIVRADVPGGTPDSARFSGGALRAVFIVKRD